MDRTIISLDYAIKNVLRDKANFAILSGFLTELLGRKVAVEEILESEGNSEHAQGKVNRLDLKAKIDGGEIAVFEFQFLDQLDFFGKILFNVCKAVVEQVSSGQLYDVKKVYSVNVAYFDLGNKEEYVFRATLMEFKGIHLDEKIPFSQKLKPEFPENAIHPEYYLILPNKFKEQIKDRFDEWVYVLKKSAVRSEFMAAGIQEAGEKLDIMKMTRQERNEYEYIRRFETDQKTQLFTAVYKGEQRGLQKGKEIGMLEGEAIGLEKGEAIGLEKGEAIGLEKGKIIGLQEHQEQTVLNAYKKGRSIDDIAEFTGLTTDQVIQILKKHGLITR
jgi:predicted transposase/invertase (TIGR01784 family)